MPTSRSWLALGKDLKRDSNVVHLLRQCLHPEVTSMLLIKLFGMFYAGQNLNPILVLCLSHSGLQSGDDGLSPLESWPNPPKESRLVVYAPGYGIFLSLSDMTLSFPTVSSTFHSRPSIGPKATIQWRSCAGATVHGSYTPTCSAFETARARSTLWSTTPPISFSVTPSKSTCASMLSAMTFAEYLHTCPSANSTS